NRKPAMPIVSPVDRHQVLAAIGVEEQLRVVCTLGQPYLQCIHRSTNVLDRKASALSDHGVSSISAYDQVCANLQKTVGRIGSNANDTANLFDWAPDLCPHSQVKCRITTSLFREKV